MFVPYTDFSRVLKVNLVSDIMDKSRNRPFSRLDWRDWVEELHEEQEGRKPDQAWIISKGDQMYEIVESRIKY